MKLSKLIPSIALILLVAGCGQGHPPKKTSPGPATGTSPATPITAAMLKSSMTQAAPDGPRSTEELAHLNRAFKAAFPQTAEVMDKDGKTTVFSPIMLIPIAGSTYALISEGTLKEEDQCQACYGALEVDYLKNENGTYSKFSPAQLKWIEGGSMGNAPMWMLKHTAAGFVMITEEDYQMERGEEQCTLGMYLLREDGIKLDVPGEADLKKGNSEFSSCSLRN